MEKKPDELKHIDEDKLLKEKYFTLNKWLLLIIGLFMLLLMLSLSIPIERLNSFLAGDKIVNNIINSNGYNIIFSLDVYSELKQKFALSDTEFEACLSGDILNNNYIIDGMYYPEVISSSFVEVTSKACNSETIISLHSHPSMFCLFSRTDYKSYDLIKQINENMMIGLMCDVDRFNFYRK